PVGFGPTRDSVNAGDEPPRARHVITIRGPERAGQQLLFGAGAKVAADGHDNAPGPDDRRGDPDRRAEREQEQPQGNGMPDGPKRAARRESMPGSERRAKAPRLEGRHGPSHQQASADDDDRADDTLPRKPPWDTPRHDCSCEAEIHEGKRERVNAD